MRAHRAPQRAFAVSSLQRELVGSARTRPCRKLRERVGNALPVLRLVDEDEGVEISNGRADLDKQGTRRGRIEGGSEGRGIEPHVIIGVIAADEFAVANAV